MADINVTSCGCDVGVINYLHRYCADHDLSNCRGFTSREVLNPPPMDHEPPPPIQLKIDASNQIYWNNTLVAVSQLQQRMEEVVQKDPTNQPQLQIDANPDSEYEVIAKSPSCC